MGTTRLIVRMRGDFKATLVGLLANNYGLEPVHFVMERKLLLDSCCSTASTAPNRRLHADRW